MAGSAIFRRRKVRRYIAVLIRWGWFVLLCGVIGAGTAYAVSKRQPPVYRASTLLTVNAGTSGDSYTNLLASNQLVQTYLHLIKTAPVLQRAAHQVGGISAAQLASRVGVSNPGISTTIIQVQVDDSNPRRAASLANAIASSFIAVQRENSANTFQDATQQVDQEIAGVTSQINSLNSQLTAQEAADPHDPNVATLRDQLGAAVERRKSLQAANALLAKQPLAGSSNVQVFEAAVPPTKPDHPVPRLYAEIGGLAGLLLAVGLVLLLEYLDDRVRTAPDVEEATGLIALGTLNNQRKERLLLTSNGNPSLAERFRSLRTNLGFVTVDTPLSTIVVTSAMRDEGKTTVAVNLAMSLAQSGKRVLLIDADLRHPSVHERLGLRNEDGLTLLLINGNLRHPSTHERLGLSNGDEPTLSLQDHDLGTAYPFVTLPGLPKLSVLTTGAVPPNPTEMLGSISMQRLLEAVLPAEEHPGLVDVVVLDTPPVAICADAAVLAANASATLLVVSAKRCREGQLMRAYGALNRVNARIVGFVLNQVTTEGEEPYYYTYESHVAQKQPTVPPDGFPRGEAHAGPGRDSGRLPSGSPSHAPNPGDRT